MIKKGLESMVSAAEKVMNRVSDRMEKEREERKEMQRAERTKEMEGRLD
jgi:regulator of protease activity HflC (stomatin/prohibitin superfamily)